MASSLLHTLQQALVHLAGLLVAAVMLVGAGVLLGRRRVLPALAGLLILLTALAAAAASAISLLALAGYPVL